jgi:hypothetical protein
MRILVLTNHFAEFAGSEIVALEVAEWFRDRGDEVTIGSNHFGAPLTDEATGITLVDNLDAIELDAFDLVWCQHDLLSQLPVATFERAAVTALPHIAMVTLSPFEPYEHLNVPLARALSADMLANSPETRDEMLRRHPGALFEDDVQVFFNAAPPHFHAASRRRARSALEHLTVVSNHVPPEMREALSTLAAEGVTVRILGKGDEWKRLQADDITATDAAVTIGKTVVYCLAQAVPVYIYDHLGGDGWLIPETCASAMHHNFSGRPARRRLPADMIAREILLGFEEASAAALQRKSWIDLPSLDLGTHLRALRRRALERPVAAATTHLRSWLQQPGMPAHLEALRQKNLVMRHSYKLAARLR